MQRDPLFRAENLEVRSGARASERKVAGAREGNPGGTEEFYAGIIRKRSERP